MKKLTMGKKRKFKELNEDKINDTTNIKELSLNNITTDASCIINYRAKDICNNWSQDISLILNFINIPYAELIGSATSSVDFSRNANYSDAGIRIYSDQTNSTPFIPRTLSGSIINEIRVNLQKQSTLYVQALYLLLQAKFGYLLHHINR